MNKKMIDADALIAFINEKIETMNLVNYHLPVNNQNIFVPVNILVQVLEKINELTTPTVPQKSNFDINKWQNYLKSNGYEGVLYKILFGNQKTEQLMPHCSGGEILRAFDDNNFNPINNEFHKNIFICLGLDVKDFLCEPQDSIFDADGWCNNLLKAPEEYIAHNGCRLAWIDHGVITPLGDAMAFDEEYFKKSMKQWRLMPTIPTGDKR